MLVRFTGIFDLILAKYALIFVGPLQRVEYGIPSSPRTLQLARGQLQSLAVVFQSRFYHQTTAGVRPIRNSATRCHFSHVDTSSCPGLRNH